MQAMKWFAVAMVMCVSACGVATGEDPDRPDDPDESSATSTLAAIDESSAAAASCHGTVSCGFGYVCDPSWTTVECGAQFCGGPCGPPCPPSDPSCAGPRFLTQPREQFRTCRRIGQTCTEWRPTTSTKSCSALCAPDDF